jgi:hypothetical protein
VVVVIVVLVVAHRSGIHSAAVTSTTTTTAAQGQCFTASQAANEIGQSGCVQFNVGYTFVSSAGNAYLDQYQNYSSGFEVWIPAGYSFGSSATTQYANETIQVSGTISSYEGAPQIEVTDPSQITLAGS